MKNIDTNAQKKVLKVHYSVINGPKKCTGSETLQAKNIRKIMLIRKSVLSIVI